MNKRMKTITRATLAALAMLALAGCSEPAYVPTQEDIEAEIEAARDALLDAQQRIDDAKTGAVWAWDTVSPAREAAPLKANWKTQLQAWWKEIWAKIKGDDPAPTPIPTPTPTPTPDPVTPPAQADVNTFLWKPVADNDGRLVVLLPANLTASTVTVNGEQPAAYTGRGNGNRQHFRFRKKGADYGDNVVVIAVGTARRWTVPKGGTRWSSN